MGHINDRTLDNLLDGSIDGETELAIEEHVRHCTRCAHRLREWELLFPQVRSLMPTGERPAAGPSAAAASPQAAFATARGPSVYVPDWSPPPSHHSNPTRVAWGLVIVLSVAAGYVIYQKTARENPAVGSLPETYEMTAQASGDSAGLGSGIPARDTAPLPTIEALRAQQESLLARRAQDSIRLDSMRAAASASTLAPTPAATAQTPPVELASREPVEQDVRRPTPTRETPVSFPIRADSASTPAQRPPAAADTSPASESPLPAQFQRTTLGEAISRLAGTVRLIQGLNPEAVEIAQGSAIPGADPGKAVVRVVYNAPEGRLIMDQQRLGRGGRSEPNIAISTAPNGVSVAQWVDRGGFWISLAGRADQQTLLAIANRIR
jgi:hypothetical protein